MTLLTLRREPKSGKETTLALSAAQSTCVATSVCNSEGGHEVSNSEGGHEVSGKNKHGLCEGRYCHCQSLV